MVFITPLLLFILSSSITRISTADANWGCQLCQQVQEANNKLDQLVPGRSRWEREFILFQCLKQAIDPCRGQKYGEKKLPQLLSLTVLSWVLPWRLVWCGRYRRFSGFFVIFLFFFSFFSQGLLAVKRSMTSHCKFCQYTSFCFQLYKSSFLSYVTYFSDVQN